VRPSVRACMDLSTNISGIDGDIDKR